jgi:hypothetical protein
MAGGRKTAGEHKIENRRSAAKLYVVNRGFRAPAE